MKGRLIGAYLLSMLCALGCEKAPEAPAPAATPEPAEAEPALAKTPTKAPVEGEEYVPVIGETTPAAVREAHANWKQKYAETQVPQAASDALAKAEPGAEVVFVFGTWCKDCYRELPRVWRAIEGVEPAPFAMRHIAVDEQLAAQGVSDLADLKVERIPTVIVRREGKEIGRIVEQAGSPFEVELARLLSGETSGVVSTSPAVTKK